MEVMRTLVVKYLKDRYSARWKELTTKASVHRKTRRKPLKFLIDENVVLKIASFRQHGKCIYGCLLFTGFGHGKTWPEKNGLQELQRHPLIIITFR